MPELTEKQIALRDEYYRLSIRELNKSLRADEEKDLSAGSGTNDLKFERIKAGRVLVIEHLEGHNDTSACTRIRLGWEHFDSIHTLWCIPAPLTTEVVALPKEVRLHEGMIPMVRFEGCTSGDDLHATLMGYWIEARKGG